MSKKESNAVTSGDAAEKDVNIVINNRGSVDGLDAAAHAAMQQNTKGRSESTASNYSESGSKRRTSKAVMIEKGYEQVALADAEAGGGALSRACGSLSRGPGLFWLWKKLKKSGGTPRTGFCAVQTRGRSGWPPDFFSFFQAFPESAIWP